jgi:hypothetical protein
MPSLIAVKPFMSQNITVIVRRCPSAAMLDWSSSPFAICGSMYLPNVSPDPCILAQLLDHAVEGLRQLRDLVASGDGNGLVEVTCFDVAGALQ